VSNPLTVKQVAERWCVSRSIVYALVANGVIPHIRVGLGRGTIRISQEDVDRYEKERNRDDAHAYAEHFA
jgi:excisionase family DNA binding protein